MIESKFETMREYIGKDVHVEGVSRSRSKMGSKIPLDLIFLTVDRGGLLQLTPPPMLHQLKDAHDLILVFSDLAKFIILGFNAS